MTTYTFRIYDQCSNGEFRFLMQFKKEFESETLMNAWLSTKKVPDHLRVIVEIV